MYKATKLICLLSLLTVPTAKAENMCRGDACLHAAISYGLAFTGAELLHKKAKISRTQSLIYSSLAVLAFGAAKEALHDDRFDSWDMKANVAGVAGAATMFYVIEF